MKRFRLYLKNAFAIALTLLVLATATGLSYQAHYCHDRLFGVAFYTELGIQKAASCGCKEDSFTGKVATSKNEPVTLKKERCCSDITFSGKLKVETLVHFYSPITLIQPVSECIGFDTEIQVASEKCRFPVNNSNYPLPSLGGRKLVLFLSQQRIPLINYNC
jgi:hypothetical protein